MILMLPNDVMIIFKIWMAISYLQTDRETTCRIAQSMTPPDIQLPFMDAPIPGFTFAVSPDRS